MLYDLFCPRVRVPLVIRVVLQVVFVDFKAKTRPNEGFLRARW
jgi:hypothetical protein